MNLHKKLLKKSNKNDPFITTQETKLHDAIKYIVEHNYIRRVELDKLEKMKLKDPTLIETLYEIDAKREFKPVKQMKQQPLYSDYYNNKLNESERENEISPYIKIENDYINSIKSNERDAVSVQDKLFNSACGSALERHKTDTSVVIRDHQNKMLNERAKMVDGNKYLNQYGLMRLKNDNIPTVTQTEESYRKNYNSVNKPNPNWRWPIITPESTYVPSQMDTILRVQYNSFH
jgi:hypothetical protein